MLTKSCAWCDSRRGRDPAARQAVPQAGPGQLGRALHRRVHVAAGAAAEPARAARHRHLRRRRQWRGTCSLHYIPFVYLSIVRRVLALVCGVLHAMRHTQYPRPNYPDYSAC